MSNFRKEIWVGIGAIALGLSLPAFAQTPPDRAQFRQQMMDRVDTDHDGKISEAEWKAATDKRFARADANGDGFVSEDEMKAEHVARRAEFEARRAEMREKREHTMFTRIDANGDGKLSKEEFEAGSQKLHERMQKRELRDGSGLNGPGRMGDAPPPDQE